MSLNPYRSNKYTYDINGNFIKINPDYPEIRYDLYHVTVYTKYGNYDLREVTRFQEESPMMGVCFEFANDKSTWIKDFYRIEAEPEPMLCARRGKWNQS